MSTTEIQGSAQASVQGVLDELVAAGQDGGLQVAAYLDGELVVDAFAGVADSRSGRQVHHDTLFPSWSTGKGVTTTALHVLVDRGVLDYDDPITRFWPEWGAFGKQGATIRDALLHRTGVPQMPAGATIADLGDWDKMCDLIANEEPLWPPGSTIAYHGYTYGYIIGQLIRRASGTDFDSFVRSEIASPLGIENDLLVSSDPAVDHRLAFVEDGGLEMAEAFIPEDSLFKAKVCPGQFLPSAELTNRREFRQSVIPSAGVFTAAAIARLYGALSMGGELDGTRILSGRAIATAAALQTDALDESFGVPIRRGLGYFLGGDLGIPPLGGISPMGSRTTAFGHNGTGGSIAFADPEYRFAFAITKTHLSVNPTETDSAIRVARTVRAAVGIPE